MSSDWRGDRVGPTMLERGGRPSLLHSCLFAWGLEVRTVRKELEGEQECPCSPWLSSPAIRGGNHSGGGEDQDAFTEGSSRKRHGSGGQKREPFLPGITDSELYQERLGHTTMHISIWWHLLPEHT